MKTHGVRHRGGIAPKPIPHGSTGLTIAVCALLTVATLAIYAQTFRYGYVSYDDNRYFSENPMVQAGLSARSVAWAFTTFYFANWHPLTWLTYLIDYQWFGLNAGAQHAVNVALHLGAAIVLFLALLRMTNHPWRSATVAGIFAVHPLHVESVAWISERKDCSLCILPNAHLVALRSIRKAAAAAEILGDGFCVCA
jgi:hypothetical protein